ncbi:MAG: ASKHA domain-containing protein [Thermodesulfobacteriota bacterium]
MGTQQERQYIEDGWVKRVVLTPPALSDNTSDADRLVERLKKELHTDRVAIDLQLLKKLPFLLREWGYRAGCVVLKEQGCWQVVGLFALEQEDPPLGVAVDLGTSRVVIRLVSLLSGDILGEHAFDNPQIPIGPDILARIHFSEKTKGLDELNRLIIDGLNNNIKNLSRSCGRDPTGIYLVSMAGNTAMTHLFMGLDPQWLIREPYIPVVNRPGMMRASDLGIAVNPSGRIYIHPNIGSYFGGDLMAGILYSGMHKTEETAILVDVGTNAEVVLGNSNWLVACAGAAGPALEGGVTRMGMLAGPGVIDKVVIQPGTGTFELSTIGNARPKGICGSGLIDLAAHLFLSGMLDIRGKFVPEACGARLKQEAGLPYLVAVPADQSATGQDLFVSQADIDSLIRSKAAMYTILETITASVGMLPRDLSTFYVAGTFGSFIDPASAISIGMLPDLSLDTFKVLGNSSLEGAAQLLTRPGNPDEIDCIRDRITYLELNVNQEFMNRFSAAKFLPHTDPSIFPSVPVNRPD